jgi:hypothetical protein
VCSARRFYSDCLIKTISHRTNQSPLGCIAKTVPTIGRPDNCVVPTQHPTIQQLSSSRSLRPAISKPWSFCPVTCGPFQPPSYLQPLIFTICQSVAHKSIAPRHAADLETPFDFQVTPIDLHFDWLPHFNPLWPSERPDRQYAFDEHQRWKQFCQSPHKTFFHRLDTTDTPNNQNVKQSEDAPLAHFRTQKGSRQLLRLNEFPRWKLIHWFAQFQVSLSSQMFFDCTFFPGSLLQSRLSPQLLDLSHLGIEMIENTAFFSTPSELLLFKINVHCQKKCVRPVGFIVTAW